MGDVTTCLIAVTGAVGRDCTNSGVLAGPVAYDCGPTAVGDGAFDINEGDCAFGWGMGDWEWYGVSGEYIPYTFGCM